MDPIESIGQQINEQLSEKGYSRSDVLQWRRDDEKPGLIIAKLEDFTAIHLQIEGKLEKELMKQIISHKEIQSYA